MKTRMSSSPVNLMDLYILMHLTLWMGGFVDWSWPELVYRVVGFIVLVSILDTAIERLDRRRARREHEARARRARERWIDELKK